MVTMDEMQRLLFSGGEVVGPDGKKIGSFGQLFLDATTGEPAWATVSTGLFGTGESFVPLTGASVRDDALHVAFDKSQVKHAPRIEGTEGALSPDEERDLYRHYGLLHDDDAADGDTGRTGHEDAAPAPDPERPGSGGDDAPGPEFLEPPIRPIGTPAVPAGVPPLPPPGTPSATEGSADLGAGAHTLVPGATEGQGPGADARPGDTLAGDGPAADERTTTSPRGDDGMVVRAERPKVIGTERVPTERVRMRRYTVTEQREITVPVTREEYRVEYEPADGAEPLTPPEDPAPDATADHHPKHRADDRDPR